MACSSIQPVLYDMDDDFHEIFDLQLGPVLGQGMTGSSVVLAIQPSGRMLAVKKLSLLTEDGGYQNTSLFRREFQALEQVSHRNISKFIFAARCPGYLAIATHFCPKGTLLDKLNLGPMTTEMCGLYFIQLACAVRYLNHHKMIVHSDIKPENVFIDDKNKPVLGDFGLSLFTTSKKPVALGGTPGYRAPELDDETVTSLSVNLVKLDVYSLGVVLWCMVYRAVPTPQTAYKYLEFMRSRPEVTQPLRWCMETMLETNPEVRPDIKHVLDSLREQQFHPQLIDTL